MSGHLDLDALADLLAGEGDDAQVDHLAGCATCSAALVDLEQACAEVSAGLAALPEPAIPDDLAARLDAALLAAREQPGAVPAPAVPLRALPLGSDQDQRRGSVRAVVPLAARRRRPVLLGAAAAAAAVVLGGTALTVVTRDGGSNALNSDALNASAGQAPEQADAPQGARGPAGATAATGRDYGPGTSGLAAGLPDLLDGPADGPSVGPSLGPSQRPSGGSADDPAAAPSALAAGGLERLHDPAALAACLSALPGAASAPLALDYARYQGRPALVVVRAAADPADVDVAVVGPGCRPGAPEQLLLTTLRRPS